MTDATVLRLFTDGASRGNPGDAALGVIIQDESGAELASAARYLGKATNNEAEYMALIHGLRLAKQFAPLRLDVFCDSELMVNQINGRYKVRNLRLAELFLQARQVMQGFASVRVRHVPREQNRGADALANQALDSQASSQGTR